MTEKSTRTYSWWWAFLPICLALGTAGGALLGNVGVGLSFGTAVGTPLNLIFYQLYRKKNQNHQA